jgi:hypothetical protein
MATPENQVKWRKNNAEKYKAYQDSYRKNNLERFNATQKKWMATHPEKAILISIKSRAKKTNVEFSLTEEDISIPELCPILKIPIKKQYTNKGKTGPRRNSPSVDRIDNTKGYIKGNVHVISNQANIMKSSATPQELLQFAYWIILTYGYLIQGDKNDT